MDSAGRFFCFNSMQFRRCTIDPLSTDEHQILEFLKGRLAEFFSVKEVSRRVGGKRRCQEEPAWAKPFLIRLANAGHISMNEIGHYRYMPPEEEKKKKGKEKLHLAPHIAAILSGAGKAHLGAVYEISDE
jgi:hypothetical protein